MNLEKQWNIFRMVVIPHDASQIQLTEMRRAFFAGAACTMTEVMEAVDKGMEDGVNHLNALHTEIIQFGIDVAQGKA